MPLSVLHVVPTLEYGAVTTRVATLCEHASRDDIEPYVAAVRGGGGAEGRVRRVAGLETLGARYACDPFAMRRLRRLIRRVRPDVVHAWGLAAGAYTAAATRAGRLLISLDPSPQPAPLWRDRLARWVLRRRPWLLCDNENPDGGPAWPGAMAAPRAAPAGEAGEGPWPEELAIPQGARVIGVAARLEPRKRVKELIWAADLVRVAHSDAHFIVMGEGPERAALERFCRMACDASRIRLVGGRDDAGALVARLDVLWHAGDELSPPLAVLEAMGAGVPVVADATRGAQAAVVDGETGCLVTPGDRAQRARATLRLLRDEPFRAAAAHAARERAERRFQVSGMLDAYRRAYEAAAEDTARVECR